MDFRVQCRSKLRPIAYGRAVQVETIELKVLQQSLHHLHNNCGSDYSSLLMLWAGFLSSAPPTVQDMTVEIWYPDFTVKWAAPHFHSWVG